MRVSLREGRHPCVRPGPCVPGTQAAVEEHETTPSPGIYFVLPQKLKSSARSALWARSAHRWRRRRQILPAARAKRRKEEKHRRGGAKNLGNFLNGLFAHITATDIMRARVLGHSGCTYLLRITVLLIANRTRFLTGLWRTSAENAMPCHSVALVRPAAIIPKPNEDGSRQCGSVRLDL